MSGTVNLQDFAERVERVCEFFLSRVSEETNKTGSHDLKVLQDLKEDAANLQFREDTPTLGAVTGLDAHMRGLPEAKE